MLSDLDYADDIAMLPSGIGDAQNFHDRLVLAAADVGLHVNATKTKVLILNHPWSLPLQVKNIDLDFDDDFNYPGSFIATTENDVKKLQGQAWDAFWRLESIGKSNLPIAIKVRLYQCTVLSVLTYGSETRTLTESLSDKLNTFQLNCLLVMLGISRRDHVTNESVYSQTQSRHLSFEVKGRQLRFLSHSLRRDKEDHINRFTLYVPSVGRRSVGGQKLLFLQYISRLITGGSRALTEIEI